VVIPVLGNPRQHPHPHPHKNPNLNHNKKNKPGVSGNAKRLVGNEPIHIKQVPNDEGNNGGWSFQISTGINL
jgi:hypothetical protein